MKSEVSSKPVDDSWWHIDACETDESTEPDEANDAVLILEQSTRNRAHKEALVGKQSRRMKVTEDKLNSLVEDLLVRNNKKRKTRHPPHQRHPGTVALTK
jgi:hypothetical protein